MIQHLSYSSVNKYRNCPRSWKLHYLEGIKKEDSEALIVGNLAHKIAEKFLLAMHGGDSSPTEKQLDSIYYEEAGRKSLKEKDIEISDDSSWLGS